MPRKDRPMHVRFARYARLIGYEGRGAKSRVAEFLGRAPGTVTPVVISGQIPESWVVKAHTKTQRSIEGIRRYLDTGVWDEIDGADPRPPIHCPEGLLQVVPELTDHEQDLLIRCAILLRDGRPHVPRDLDRQFFYIEQALEVKRLPPIIPRGLDAAERHEPRVHEP